jgi:hypothetical protein
MAIWFFNLKHNNKKRANSAFDDVKSIIELLHVINSALHEVGRGLTIERFPHWFANKVSLRLDEVLRRTKGEGERNGERERVKNEKPPQIN